MKEIRVQHTAKISSSREGDVWIIQSLEVRMLDHSGQATGCPGSTCSTWGGWPGATKPRAQPPNRSIHRRYQSALVSVKHSVILRSEAKQIQYYYIDSGTLRFWMPRLWKRNPAIQRYIPGSYDSAFNNYDLCIDFVNSHGLGKGHLCKDNGKCLKNPKKLERTDQFTEIEKFEIRMRKKGTRIAQG